MFVYIFILIILIILSFKYDIMQNKAYRNDALAFCMVLLTMLSGFRNEVGSDTVRVYGVYFDYAPNIYQLFTSDFLFNIGSQPLWALMMSLVKTFTNEFFIFQIIQAAFFHFFLYKFLINFEKGVFVILLILYCILWWDLCFEVIREASCVVLFLNAMLALQQSKLKQYILYSLPAIFIHWFAFVPFAILLISKYISYKIVAYSIAVLLILYLIVGKRAETLFNTYALLIDASGTHAEYYLIDGFEGYRELKMSYIIQLIAIRIIPSIILSVFIQWRSRYDMISKVILFYAFFSILEIRLAILHRFLNYFTIPLIVFLVQMIFYTKSKFTLIKTYLSLSLMAMLYVGIMNFYKPKSLSNEQFNTRYIPYTSIFEKPYKNRPY